MDTVRTVAALREAVRRWRQAGDTVGLVPTMGALHAGHMALVRAAQAAARRTVATIFVNPTQFGPQEDLAAYPRDEAADRATLQAAGTDLLFAPAVATMYPPGFATTVAVAALTEPLCGRFRPGHFAGVATVVTKLLLQALPDVACFGEKDYQQLLVIRRLVRDLDIPVRVLGVPTVREADGLALSSRNRYLAPAERRIAAALPRTLRELARAIEAGAAIAPALAAATAALRAAGFDKLDYLELRDPETLAPRERLDGPARLFAAAWIGRTRLIDNWPVAAAAPEDGAATAAAGRSAG